MYVLHNTATLEYSLVDEAAVAVSGCLFGWFGLSRFAACLPALAGLFGLRRLSSLYDFCTRRCPKPLSYTRIFLVLSFVHFPTHPHLFDNFENRIYVGILSGMYVKYMDGWN